MVFSEHRDKRARNHPNRIPIPRSSKTLRLQKALRRSQERIHRLPQRWAKDEPLSSAAKVEKWARPERGYFGEWKALGALDFGETEQPDLHFE